MALESDYSETVFWPGARRANVPAPPAWRSSIPRVLRPAALKGVLRALFWAARCPQCRSAGLVLKQNERVRNACQGWADS